MYIRYIYVYIYMKYKHRRGKKYDEERDVIVV